MGIVTAAGSRRQSNLHSREMKMAQVSCIIVAGEDYQNKCLTFLTILISVFIVCHGVRWIPNVYELTRAEQKEVLMQS